MLTPDLAQRYLEILRDCNSAASSAQVRQAGRLRRDVNILESPDMRHIT